MKKEQQDNKEQNTQDRSGYRVLIRPLRCLNVLLSNKIHISQKLSAMQKECRHAFC